METFFVIVEHTKHIWNLRKLLTYLKEEYGLLEVDETTYPMINAYETTYPMINAYDMITFYKHSGKIYFVRNLSKWFDSDVDNVFTCPKDDYIIKDKIKNATSDRFKDGQWVCLNECGHGDGDNETWITRYGENYDYNPGVSWTKHKDLIDKEGRCAESNEIIDALERENKRLYKLLLEVKTTMKKLILN